MPGKKGAKGGKKKRRGKKDLGNDGPQRRIITSDGPYQRYAQALKMLGDRRIAANVYDPDRKIWEEKLIHVRGKFRKRVWINIGDLVLISTRPFETDGSGSSGDEGSDKLPFGGDVIHKYSPQEAKKLLKMGEIKMNDEDSEDDGHQNRFYFDSEDSDEDGEDDSEKPPRPQVAPQQRVVMMPPSDSEEESLDIDNMNKAQLEDVMAYL